MSTSVHDAMTSLVPVISQPQHNDHARCELPFHSSILVVATYTTNSFKLLHGKTRMIACNTHVQNSTLFFVIENFCVKIFW